MTARDELENMIHDAIYPGGDRDDRMTWPRSIFDAATAILAAGYSKPRTITTTEELDALGFQAVVRDAEDYVLERWGEPEEQMWATPMNSAWIRSTEVTLPATVLYEPQP